MALAPRSGSTRLRPIKAPRQARSISVNPRRYFDRETNEWKDAPSFNPSDLPALIFALTKAQEYCYETPLPAGEESELGSGARR